MDKFIPRTEQDRIQIAILDCLDGILKEIKKIEAEMKYNDEQIINDKAAEQIKKEVAEIKKTPKKQVK